MRILYDSKSPVHKTPFGCLHVDELCRLCLHIPKSCRTRRASLYLAGEDGFSMTVPMTHSGGDDHDQYAFYSTEFSLFRCGLYFYHFRIETEESNFALFKFGTKDTNMEDGDPWQLSCVPKKSAASADFDGAVYYQIFPDRFFKSSLLPAKDKLTPYSIHTNEEDTPAFLPDADGRLLNNDFFGGNLSGITEKLPYLASLGVKVLYLNPIFKAFSNHRYDTADYKKIDPLLGSEADFTLLCTRAHALGMRVLLDGVFSHTGSDSVYFDKCHRGSGGAYYDASSPYRPWYQFTDNPDGYTSWWGIETLPCVNELDPSFLHYIIEDEDSVVAHWLRAGADGFRLDVADELPDEFLRRLHRRVHELKPDALVLGEVWEDASNKVSYGVRRRYFTDGELDSVMNYPFRDALLSFILGASEASGLADTVMTIAENYPSDVLCRLMNSLSTHDTPRILTILSGLPTPVSREERACFTLCPKERERALAKEQLLAFLQFMLPGSPCIYYGDEAGLEGFEDPFNRRFFPWGREEASLTGFYRRLSALKNTLPALRIGETRADAPSRGVFSLVRTAADDTLFALVSRDEDFAVSPGTVLFSEGYENGVLHSGGFMLFRR